MKHSKKQPPIHVVWRPASSAVQGRGTVLVLVHGSWHGAWIWEAFQAFLAQQGYESLALNLRGHGDQSEQGKEARSGGSVTRWVSLDDYAHDVAHALSEHLPKGARFVFVAHSLAGRVLVHYLTRQRQDGWPFPAGIVCMATVPPWGVLPSTIRLMLSRAHGASVLDALFHGEMRRLVNTPPKAHALFRHALPGLSDDEREAFQKRLGDEALWGYGQTVLPCPLRCWRQGKRLRQAGVPVLVVGGKDDPIISEREAQQTARTYGTQNCFTFSRLSHDLMLHIPEREEVTTCLLAWLDALSVTNQTGGAARA